MLSSRSRRSWVGQGDVVVGLVSGAVDAQGGDLFGKPVDHVALFVQGCCADGAAVVRRCGAVVRAFLALIAAIVRAMGAPPPRLYARLRPDQRRFALMATGVFSVVGLAFLAASVAFLVLPFAAQCRAAGWVAVPCVVARTVPDGDGKGYHMIMEYAHDGRTYRSERMWFYPVRRAAYVEGTRLQGWMDAQHPEEFVFDRDQGPGWVAVVVMMVGTGLPLVTAVRMVAALLGRGKALEAYFTAETSKNREYYGD